MKKILFLFLFLPFFGMAQSIECADCLKIKASCETCNGTTDSELFYGVVLKNKAGTITDKIRKPFKSVIQKGSKVTVKGFDDRVTEFQLPCYGYNSTASLVAKLCECQSPPSSGGTGLTNIANNTILGNVSGASAVPVALTPMQIKTMLGVTTGDVITTAPLTIGGVVYAAGTSIQTILNALNNATNKTFDVITPTTYADLAAQTVATLNGQVTKNTTTGDIVMKDLNGDVVRIAAAAPTVLTGYVSDAAAAATVPIGSQYYVLIGNSYGNTAGTVRVRLN